MEEDYILRANCNRSFRNLSRLLVYFLCFSSGRRVYCLFCSTLPHALKAFVILVSSVSANSSSPIEKAYNPFYDFVHNRRWQTHCSLTVVALIIIYTWRAPHYHGYGDISKFIYLFIFFKSDVIEKQNLHQQMLRPAKSHVKIAWDLRN